MNDNHKNVTLEAPSPEWLGKLAEQIFRRLKGRLCDFRLSMRDGGLVLAGHAPSYYAKQLAQHAVMEAMVLPICANDIEVL